MWCMNCKHDLSECECPDLQERLQSAMAGGHVAIKWCSKCDHSYHSCRCAAPDFYIRRSTPTPGEPEA